MLARLGAAALALVLVPALGGCNGDDPEPKISDSPSVTESSPSPSPTATTSAPPEQESPIAFMRRWGVVSAEMQNSGATRTYQTLIDPNCEPCNKFMQLVEGYYRDGGYVKTQPWQVNRVTKRPPSNPGEREFEVEVTTSMTEYKTSATAPLKTLEGGDTRLAVTLRRDETSWLILNYLVIAS